ncbi:ROK family transcriptional regulator [Pseudooceanicola aestuarii]|uniref:ROK family transcriptional regulator n=1 Tax=Pseudooceanicola aestuarii TaxID=2697319 RepID=UPI0013D5074A|nr:ROK family transcriptional regulator [Pseudooceanicola aestuarii]
MDTIRDALTMDARAQTRLRILDIIRASDGIARKEIAALASTSPATVTTVTADMLDKGLIREVPFPDAPGAGRRGRPRVMLKLRGGVYPVAGVKISRHTISVLIADFEGTELANHVLNLAASCMEPPDLVAALRRAIEGACTAGGLALTDLTGISVGLAGQVDATRNYVHWSSSLAGHDHDLAPLLRDSLPCPVFLENDANLVAKAEQLFGEGRDVDNFLVVTVEHGVGLGIIMNGQIYRGDRGCGAEFGHTKVQIEGALCQCGQRGCLEAYVGDYALIREASTGEPENRPRTVAEVTARARAGDRLAQSVLDRAGQMFAMGLANLINIFDPRRIILAGAQTGFAHLYSDKVLEQISRSTAHVNAPLPDIRVHNWGDLMWARGASAHAIEQVSILHIKGMPSHAA